MEGAAAGADGGAAGRWRSGERRLPGDRRGRRRDHPRRMADHERGERGRDRDLHLRSPTGSVLGTENVITAGAGNENVRLAGTPSGWLAVWDDGTQIKMRSISGDGTPSGPEIRVSDPTHTGTQEHPGVAVLADGRSAIVWADHGTAQGADIFVQRYDANLVAVAGDQTAAINDVVTAGDQVSPAIAGTTSPRTDRSRRRGSTPRPATSARADPRRHDGLTTSQPQSGGGGWTPRRTSSKRKHRAGVECFARTPLVAIGGSGPWIAIGWDVAGRGQRANAFPTSTTETPPVSRGVPPVPAARNLAAPGFAYLRRGGVQFSQRHSFSLWESSFHSEWMPLSLGEFISLESSSLSGRVHLSLGEFISLWESSFHPEWMPLSQGESVYPRTRAPSSRERISSASCGT